MVRFLFTNSCYTKEMKMQLQERRQIHSKGSNFSDSDLNSADELQWQPHSVHHKQQTGNEEQ